MWERELISLHLILSGFWYLLISTPCGNNTLAWLKLLTKSFFKKIHDKNSMTNIIIGNFCSHFRKGEMQSFNRLWPLRSTKYCLRQHCCPSDPYIQPFFNLWMRALGGDTQVLLGSVPTVVTVMICNCGWISPVSNSFWTQLCFCLSPHHAVTKILWFWLCGMKK